MKFNLKNSLFIALFLSIFPALGVPKPDVNQAFNNALKRFLAPIIKSHLKEGHIKPEFVEKIQKSAFLEDAPTISVEEKIEERVVELPLPVATAITTYVVAVKQPKIDLEKEKQQQDLNDLIHQLYEYIVHIDTAKNQFFSLENKEKYGVHIARAEDNLKKIKKVDTIALSIKKNAHIPAEFTALHEIARELSKAQEEWVKTLKSYKGKSGYINAAGFGTALLKIKKPAEKTCDKAQGLLKKLIPHAGENKETLDKSIHLLTHLFKSDMGAVEGIGYLSHRLSLQ